MLVRHSCVWSITSSYIYSHTLQAVEVGFDSGTVTVWCKPALSFLWDIEHFLQPGKLTVCIFLFIYLFLLLFLLENTYSTRFV